MNNRIQSIPKVHVEVIGKVIEEVFNFRNVIPAGHYIADIIHENDVSYMIIVSRTSSFIIKLCTRIYNERMAYVKAVMCHNIGVAIKYLADRGYDLKGKTLRLKGNEDSNVMSAVRALVVLEGFEIIYPGDEEDVEVDIDLDSFSKSEIIELINYANERDITIRESIVQIIENAINNE